MKNLRQWKSMVKQRQDGSFLQCKWCLVTVQREAVHSNLTVKRPILSISLKYKQPLMTPTFKGELYTSSSKTNLSRKKSTYKTLNVLIFRLSKTIHADEITTMSQWFMTLFKSWNVLKNLIQNILPSFHLKAPPKREIFGHPSYLLTWSIVLTHSKKIIDVKISTLGLFDSSPWAKELIYTIKYGCHAWKSRIWKRKSLWTTFKACTLQLLCYKNTLDYH